MNERYALPTVHPYVSLLRKRSFMKRFSFIPFDVSIEGGLASQVEELKFPVYGEGLIGTTSLLSKNFQQFQFYNGS